MTLAFAHRVKVFLLFSIVLIDSSCMAANGRLAAKEPDKITAKRPATDQCEPYENTIPLCVFSNPEDIAAIPGQDTLIISEYGDQHGSRPGRLMFYNYREKRPRIAYDGTTAVHHSQQWGETACTEPPGKLFSPHGIDLHQRHDGRWQLLVVQHGGRESVEFFELVGEDSTLALVWRGCVFAPKNASLNAVAAGKDGDFFTTKMQAVDYTWQSQTDNATASGVVYRWSAQTGYTTVPGSEGFMPNGIAASADGRVIYVVYSGEDLVKVIDVDGSGVLNVVRVKSGDNVKWAADRKTLTVASFVGSEGSAVFATCTSSTIAVCPIDFAILELDPESLEKTTLFQNKRAPMGAGTTGLKIGTTLFIGTFSGNRILQIDLSGTSSPAQFER